MRKPSTRSFSGAIIGLIAMWALLLQGALYAAEAQAFDPAHGVICAHEQGDAPAAPDHAHHLHPCCTVCHVSEVALPALLASSFQFARMSSAPALWTIASFLEKTGPPDHDHNPRGPPAA